MSEFFQLSSQVNSQETFFWVLGKDKSELTNNDSPTKISKNILQKECKIQ